MNKKINTILIPFFIIFIYLEIISYPNNILESVNLGLSIWINNIFPVLFPVFIVSAFLMSTGIEYMIGELFRPLMYKLFKIKGETVIVLLLSMFNGFPSGAKYTKDLYEKKIINEFEASKLLTFTHYANPLFIISTIGITFYKSSKIGLIILISHYLGGIITGILFRNYYISKLDNNSISLTKGYQNMIDHKSNLNLGLILYNAIKNAIDTLFLILGVIIIFIILTNIINNNINFGTNFSALVNSILEITGGLKQTSILNLSIKNKVAFTTLFLSFSGLAVHMQVYSIICDTKIKYYPFLIARILHACLSLIIVLLLYSVSTS